MRDERNKFYMKDEFGNFCVCLFACFFFSIVGDKFKGYLTDC